MFIDTLNETLNKSIIIADCLLLIMIYNAFIVLHNTGVFFVRDHGRISLDFKRHWKKIIFNYNKQNNKCYLNSKKMTKIKTLHVYNYYNHIFNPTK